MTAVTITELHDGSNLCWMELINDTQYLAGELVTDYDLDSDFAFRP